MAGFLSPPSLARSALRRRAAKGSRAARSLACQRRRVRPRLGAAAAALFLLLCPARASSEPRPLKDNQFSIDLFQGPILAPISVTGIGGAYAAYAEGISGMVANAAAPAVREPFSVNYFEFDGSGSISIPVSLFENNDFDNSGSLDYDYSNFLYGTLGGLLQYGPVGAGANAELQRYSLTDTQGRTTNVLVGRYHLLFGVRLFGDQLMLGAGARFATLGLEAEKNLTMLGAAPEFGLLIRPDWQSFRIGATLRMPVDGGRLGEAVSVSDEVRRAGGLILPNHVVLPLEIEAGIALQVGPRPLNPTWSNPREEEQAVRAVFAERSNARHARNEAELATIGDRAVRQARKRVLDMEEQQDTERDYEEEQRRLAKLKPGRRARSWNWPREHLLLTAEILVSGSVDNGVSIQGFLGQNQMMGQNPNVVGASGASINFSPRFGVEGEPIPDLVHTRVGSYYEPSRFAALVGRQHFTFGADVKLFKTTWFGLVPEVIYKLQGSADLAPRYESFSAGFGVWH